MHNFWDVYKTDSMMKYHCKCNNIFEITCENEENEIIHNKAVETNNDHMMKEKNNNIGIGEIHLNYKYHHSRNKSIIENEGVARVCSNENNTADKNAACIQNDDNDTDANDAAVHECSNDYCNDKSVSANKDAATMSCEGDIPEHHANHCISTFVVAMMLAQRKVASNKLMNVNGNDKCDSNELRLNTMNSKEETIFKIKMSNDKSIEVKKRLLSASKEIKVHEGASSLSSTKTVNKSNVNRNHEHDTLLRKKTS